MTNWLIIAVLAGVRASNSLTNFPSLHKRISICSRNLVDASWTTPQVMDFRRYGNFASKLLFSHPDKVGNPILSNEAMAWANCVLRLLREDHSFSAVYRVAGSGLPANWRQHAWHCILNMIEPTELPEAFSYGITGSAQDNVAATFEEMRGGDASRISPCH